MNKVFLLKIIYRSYGKFWDFNWKDILLEDCYSFKLAKKPFDCSLEIANSIFSCESAVIVWR